MSTDFMFRGFEMQPELRALCAERSPPRISVCTTPASRPVLSHRGRWSPGRGPRPAGGRSGACAVRPPAANHGAWTPTGPAGRLVGVEATGDPEPEGQFPQTVQATEQA